MPSTRESAQKYIDFIAALKFAEAFEMLASDAKYRIIGKTPLSKTYSRADLLNVLVPALAEFKQPPTLTFQELIVEGNRAVALASGHGISPAGLPYDQPHYAMILRIENGGHPASSSSWTRSRSRPKSSGANSSRRMPCWGPNDTGSCDLRSLKFGRRKYAIKYCRR